MKRHFLQPHPSAPRPNFSFSDLQSASTGSGNASPNFTFTLGADASNRYLLVLVSWVSSNASAQINSTTAGGTACTRLGGNVTGSSGQSARDNVLYRVPFPTGQSVTVIPSVNNVVGNVFCAVWEVIGTPALVASDFHNPTNALATSANGCAVTAVEGQYNGSTPTVSSTPMTLEKFVYDAASPFFYTAVADQFPTSGSSLTNTLSGTNITTNNQWCYTLSIT